jgi:hypothetical protein
MTQLPFAIRSAAAPRAGMLAACGLAAMMLGGCVTASNPLDLSTYRAPAADSDVCHERGRRQFYEASNAAIAAEQRRRAVQGASDLARSQPGQIITGWLGGYVPMGATAINAAVSLLDVVRQYANEDSGLIREVSARFEETTRCRQAEMAKIRSDLRARRITQEAAREQAAKLQREATADAAVARDVNQRLAARNANYLIAAREIDTSLPAGDPNLAARRAETAAVRDTVQTNQRALAAQSSAIARSEDVRLFDTSELARPRAFA